MSGVRVLQGALEPFRFIKPVDLDPWFGAIGSGTTGCNRMNEASHSFTARRKETVAKKGEADLGGQGKAEAVPVAKEPKKADASGGFNPNSFIQGIKEELDKVVWPSRQQLISESLAVILMVTLSATIIYLVDNFFGWAAKQVF